MGICRGDLFKLFQPFQCRLIIFLLIIKIDQMSEHLFILRARGKYSFIELYEPMWFLFLFLILFGQKFILLNGLLFFLVSLISLCKSCAMGPLAWCQFY